MASYAAGQEAGKREDGRRGQFIAGSRSRETEAATESDRDREAGREAEVVRRSETRGAGAWEARVIQRRTD